MRTTFIFAAISLGLLSACDTQVNNANNDVQVASEVKSKDKPISSIDVSIQQNIEKALTQAYPEENIKIESVSATPIAGLYEVVIYPKQLIYADAKGQYMLVGNLMDVAKQVNLTQERLADLNRVDYKTLPLDKAIKEVRGNGQNHVVVFSDVDCPFCKRLEAEIAQMTDVTVHTFLMPIDSLHPQARAKSKQIWCQSDRTTAWTKWMRESVTPPSVAECDNPVDELVQLGEKLGFNGTPTLVFPNGKVQSGYLAKADFEKALKENQK